MERKELTTVCFSLVRYKNGKKLHELFTTLMTIMSEICQHQFSSLKFGFGPICPIKQCPGLSYHGKDLQSNSSSEVSDDELNGNSTCDDWAVTALSLEVARSVLTLSALTLFGEKNKVFRIFSHKRGIQLASWVFNEVIRFDHESMTYDVWRVMCERQKLFIY